MPWVRARWLCAERFAVDNGARSIEGGVSAACHRGDSAVGDSECANAARWIRVGVGNVNRAVPTLEGRRLVIDATYMPGATEQDRAELAKDREFDRISSPDHTVTSTDLRSNTEIRFHPFQRRGTD